MNDDKDAVYDYTVTPGAGYLIKLLNSSKPARVQRPRTSSREEARRRRQAERLTKKQKVA